MNTAPSTTLETIVVTTKKRPMVVSQDNATYNANIATVGSKTPEFLENILHSVRVVTNAKIEDLSALLSLSIKKVSKSAFAAQRARMTF